MHKTIRKQLEKCNRLVVDTRGVDWSPFDGLGNDAFTVAVQSLPIIPGETLRLDFVVDGNMTAIWSVDRIDDIDYYFHWPDMAVGGRFLVGGYDRETFKKRAVGWVGALGHDEWMGPKIVGPLQAMLIWFFDEVEKRRLYPFVSNPMDDARKLKSPGKRRKLQEQTNAIVYLGRPPGTSPPKKTDEASTPREFGFPRRQHRRTLRAERFKNHPKYGVYKGVLVSQSWCGPKEYIHKRKVYRLWEPPEIDTTG